MAREGLVGLIDSDYNTCPRTEEELMHEETIRNQGYKQGRADGRLNTLNEIQDKMISFHIDMIFKYGVDIIEARADAFGELKDWLKEQIEMYGEYEEPKENNNGLE